MFSLDSLAHSKTVSNISPEKIRGPYQFLAAAGVVVLLLEVVLLSAATLVDDPSWAPAVLITTAVLLPPFFGWAYFLLQTRYRRELQADRYYAEVRKREEAIRSNTQSLRSALLEKMRDRASLETVGTSGTGREQVPLFSREIRALQESLWHASIGIMERTRSDALFELGRSLMAERKWYEAATYLAECARFRPNDWEVHHLNAISHANSDRGPATDLQALRAVNEALATAPGAILNRKRSRWILYRGILLFRLGIVDEAETSLALALDLTQDADDLLQAALQLLRLLATKGDSRALKRLVGKLKRESPHLIAPIIERLSSEDEGILEGRSLREMLECQ